MTLATQTSFAQRFARLGTGFDTVTDTADVTKQYINEGVREFSKRVNGIANEAYLTLTPRFDAQLNFAINFTFTGGKNSMSAANVLIASGVLTDASGSTVASYLQAAVNYGVSAALGSASVVIGWSASTWAFYVDASCTSMKIAAPSDIRYIDACGLIFGETYGTKVAASYTGQFPLDCTVESTLPTGYINMEYAKWDVWKLSNAPWGLFYSPMGSGTPQYYAVRNDRIRIFPVPTSQKAFYLRYKGAPSDLSVSGSSDATACPLPDKYHMAPVYWAAASLLEESHEFDKAVEFQRKFYAMTDEYKIRETNQNPTLRPREEPYVPFKVVPSVP